MAESPESALKILVARPDRIGDVILSTPVFEVLKRHYPSARITALVRQEVAPLLRGLSGLDEVMIYDPRGRHQGVAGLFRLASDLRRGDFRIAVVLQSPWRIAAALFLAGVQYRVGPLSKPHSFLFYNRGVRQRRSQVEMHESDYNLQLLRRLGIRVGTRNFPVAVAIPAPTRERAVAWLKERGWDRADGTQSRTGEASRWIAVHPGMAGSALNWPEAHYVELIRQLLGEGHRVLVTGGPAEGELLERVRAALGPAAEHATFYAAAVGSSIDELGALYAECDLVVAPSTGPLHLAVAVGKPVVTFYPPVRVMSAIRWGPYGPDERRASVLVPEVYCGQDFKCIGALCNYHPCMKGLGVNQALEEVHRQLAEVPPHEKS